MCSSFELKIWYISHEWISNDGNRVMMVIGVTDVTGSGPRGDLANPGSVPRQARKGLRKGPRKLPRKSFWRTKEGAVSVLEIGKKEGIKNQRGPRRGLSQSHWGPGRGPGGLRKVHLLSLT
jgi:hypothetical protein